jgi:GNAT superfamily N-acetyltransferase
MPLSVQPVSSRGEQREFIKFAWDLYRGDPNWVPPLRMSIKELLGYKHHPFYDNGAIQTFLARDGQKVVGRIAAIIDGAHNQTHQEKRGMVGFFESIDDTRVSTALFDAARQWLRGKGMTALRGPLNPALNYECALLVDGFDSPPTFLMTYNKDYYGRLFEDYGFRKSQDLYAFWGHVNMLESLDPKLLSLAQQVQERFKITVRPSTKKTFSSDIEAFLKIYNRALPGTWGFVPLSDSEVRHIASGLKMLIVPELVRIAEHEGKPVGAVFGLLDFNPVIKQIDGRLFPLGFLKILFGRKKLKRIRLVSTNVLPEYQRFGLPLVLMKSLLESALAWGIEEGEFSWVLESNALSRGTLERGGAKLTKTYRIYDLEPA